MFSVSWVSKSNILVDVYPTLKSCPPMKKPPPNSIGGGFFRSECGMHEAAGIPGSLLRDYFEVDGSIYIAVHVQLGGVGTYFFDFGGHLDALTLDVHVELLFELLADL